MLFLGLCWWSLTFYKWRMHVYFSVKLLWLPGVKNGVHMFFRNKPETLITFCTKYFKILYISQGVYRSNMFPDLIRGEKVKPCIGLQWGITYRKPDIYVHAHVVHRERQLSSMMSRDIVCPRVRGCLLRIQIPLSWQLHACPCVWSHWPTCCHSFIIKNRQGAWHGVDRDKRSPLFWGFTVLQPHECTW